MFRHTARRRLTQVSYYCVTHKQLMNSDKNKTGLKSQKKVAKLKLKKVVPNGKLSSLKTAKLPSPKKKSLFFNSLVFLCLSHFDFFTSLYFLRSFAVGALISSSFHFSAGAVSLKKSIKQKYTSFFVSSAAFRFQFFFFFEKFVQFLLR